MVRFYFGRIFEYRMITVNGKQVEFVVNQTITDLVKAQNLKTERVAVELNDAIVPRSAFDATLLHDDDKVEIVHFVGGG